MILDCKKVLYGHDFAGTDENILIAQPDDNECQDDGGPIPRRLLNCKPCLDGKANGRRYDPENTHLLHMGKYHCTADLLFDWFVFSCFAYLC